MLKQRQRQHRLRRAPFLHNEQDRQHRRGRQARDHERMAPAKRAAFDDRAGKTTKGCDRRALARQIDLALLMSWGLGGIAPAQPQAGETDRQIDQEDRPPANQRNQAAANQRPGDQCEAGTGGPNSHRATALFFVRVGVAEQRKGVGNENGGTESLDRSCRDQDRGIGRECTGERRCRENRKTRHEDSLGAEPIAERAGSQNEGGEGDGVGADNPLQLGNAAAQRGADAVERGVDDGDIELNDAIAEAHGRQRQRRRKI